MGMDINRLNELRDYVGGNGVVIRDGYLVYSWGSQSQRNDIASAVKPFYSHFLLEAVDSGLLTSIDQRINTFETCVNNINANLNYKDRSITFKQLANQISCYGVRENPGACFDYNDYNMALFFDTLFLKVYGATYSTVDSNVLNQRLGNLLQFQDNPTFLGTGLNFQMGRMNISTRDLARFGLLYMRNGNWNGQQLIRQQDAVMAVTSPLPLSIPRTTATVAQMCHGQRTIGSTTIPDDQTDHNGGYSFAWWLNGVNRVGSRNWPRAPLDTYAALGFGATRSLVVMPDLDIVVAWNNPYRSSNVFVDRAFDYINRSAVVREINQPQINTHYLKDKNGNYQFFIGGYPFYPASPFSPYGSTGDINWIENLEYSRLRGYNMVRGLGSGDGWVEPPINDDYPFRRSNVCCAFDGGNKFDLSQLNEAFFQDIGLALTAAESKGLTVINEFFGVSGPFGCNPGSSCFTNFSNNFWHSRNSIGGANWVDKTQARQDFFNPRGSLHAVQERALNRYLEVVCDHPNVIHQPVNEIHQYTGMENADEFEDWIRDKIRNPTYCGANAVVLLNNEISANFGIDRTGYQGITIHAPHRSNGAFPNGFSVDQMISTMRDIYGRNKFIGFDVDVGRIPAVDDYRKGAWTALTTGSGGFIVLYYQHRDPTQSPRRGVVDADLPHLANFLRTKQIKPWEMDPTQTTLVRSGTATLLVDTNNKKVLTYLRNGGTIQLDLGQFQGSLNVEWYNPREGTIDRTTTISGGSVLSFTPPSQTSSDWVLYITPSTQQRCSDNTPYNQCSSNKPLYCDNGNLVSRCGSPQTCGCPQNIPVCNLDGTCSGTQNQPPTATITLPTQTTFIINTQINYNGQGSDQENQPLTYTWTYDIIGDTSPEFPLPPGQSGTFTPTILVRNQSTIYTLKLVVRDTQGATGTAMKNLTINPGASQSCTQLGGLCCTAGQSCNGNIVSGTGCTSNLCCVGTCTTPPANHPCCVPLITTGFWGNWEVDETRNFGNGDQSGTWGWMQNNAHAATWMRGITTTGYKQVTLSMDIRFHHIDSFSDGAGGTHLFGLSAVCGAHACDRSATIEQRLVRLDFSRPGRNGVRMTLYNGDIGWRQETAVDFNINNVWSLETWNHIEVDARITGTDLTIKVTYNNDPTKSITKTIRNIRSGDVGWKDIYVGNMDRRCPPDHLEGLCQSFKIDFRDITWSGSL